MVLIGGGLVELLGAGDRRAASSSSRATCSARYTETWLLWYGLLFMAMVLFKPEGIAGHLAGGRGAPAPAAHGARSPARSRDQRRTEALHGPLRSHGTCTSASATRSCCRTSASRSRKGGCRDHGSERRRQDDLLQRADRPLSRPTAARVRFAGEDITGLAPRADRAQGHLALVPDHEPVQRLHARSTTC